VRDIVEMGATAGNTSFSHHIEFFRTDVQVVQLPARHDELPMLAPRSRVSALHGTGLNQPLARPRINLFAFLLTERGATLRKPPSLAGFFELG
jgi:hypothetical protein